MHNERFLYSYCQLIKDSIKIPTYTHTDEFICGIFGIEKSKLVFLLTILDLIKQYV
jgi:hypothetical protein